MLVQDLNLSPPFLFSSDWSTPPFLPSFILSPALSLTCSFPLHFPWWIKHLLYVREKESINSQVELNSIKVKSCIYSPSNGLNPECFHLNRSFKYPFLRCIRNVVYDVFIHSSVLTASPPHHHSSTNTIICFDVSPVWANVETPCGMNKWVLGKI